MTQVMGEDLAFFHACPAAQGFHAAPDIPAVYGPSGAGYKDTAAGTVLLTAVFL